MNADSRIVMLELLHRCPACRHLNCIEVVMERTKGEDGRARVITVAVCPCRKCGGVAVLDTGVFSCPSGEWPF